MRNIQTGNIVRFVIPILFVAFLIVQWVLFGVAFAIAVPAPPVIIDGLGLAISIISMLLILAAIYRDYFFKQKEDSSEVRN